MMSARGQPLSRARLITSGKIHSGRFTDRTKALNCPRVSQTSSVKYGPGLNPSSYNPSARGNPPVSGGGIRDHSQTCDRDDPTRTSTPSGRMTRRGESRAHVKAAEVAAPSAIATATATPIRSALLSELSPTRATRTAANGARMIRKAFEPDHRQTLRRDLHRSRLDRNRRAFGHCACASRPTPSSPPLLNDRTRARRPRAERPERAPRPGPFMLGERSERTGRRPTSLRGARASVGRPR